MLADPRVGQEVEPAADSLNDGALLFPLKIYRGDFVNVEILRAEHSALAEWRLDLVNRRLAHGSGMLRNVDAF